MTSLLERERDTAVKERPAIEPSRRIEPLRPTAKRGWSPWMISLLIVAVVAVGAVVFVSLEEDAVVTAPTGTIPAHLTELEAAVGIGVVPTEPYVPYASSIAAYHEFLALQAAELPYASSIAAYEEFLALQEVAELPYASSVAVYEEFLALQEAAKAPPVSSVSPLSYASSVAAYNEFLALQEVAELPYASSIAAYEEFLMLQQAAELPYASSVAAYEEFLALQEAAD